MMSYAGPKLEALRRWLSYEPPDNRAWELDVKRLSNASRSGAVEALIHDLIPDASLHDVWREAAQSTRCTA